MWKKLISGLIVPKKRRGISRFGFEGIFEVDHFDKNGNFKGHSRGHNLTLDAGLTDNIGVYFSQDAQKNNWYVGLKGTNQTPAANWISANIGSIFTEFTNYNEATRVAWQEAGASNKTITNSANPAEFNMLGAGTIYGAFLISVSTKGGTTGIMWCCSDFAVSRPVIAGDILRVTYSLANQDV